MRVILTGGAGNIGRVVAARLRPTAEVTVVDRLAPADTAGCYQVLDLTSWETVNALAGDWDAIVHLAAIPNPFLGAWEEVLRVNMLGTFNVLRFAAERGIPRVIFGSSESASGWGIHRNWYRPDYLPIDERHRSLPSEVYSYTKAFGDELCQGFSREHGLDTICLRYTWVLYDPHIGPFRDMLRAGGERAARGATYAWIHVDDVASAIAASLALPVVAERSETFYLTAREQFGTETTGQLVERNWGDGPGVPMDNAYYAGNEYGSFFDIRKAARVLGWRPEWDLARMKAQGGDQ